MTDKRKPKARITEPDNTKQQQPEQTRAAAAQKWMIANFGQSDQVLVPFESLTVLKDLVGACGVLQSCNLLKATLTGCMGYEIKSSPYTEKPLDETERAALENWVRDKFEPSFSTVWKQVLTDLEDFGCGYLQVSELLLKKAANGLPEIQWIKHQNRMTCQPLSPKKIKITVPAKDGQSQTKEVDDPQDVEFPRYVIGRDQNNLTYAKTYGDPRYIHRYTGETQEKSWGMQNGVILDGPSIIALKQYDARDEACGVPQWYAERKSVHTHVEIARYQRDHFRDSCLPNMINIIPLIEVEGGGSLGKKIDGMFNDVREVRQVGGATRRSITVEVPVEYFDPDTGKLQFEIKEIKGPDAAQFRELDKHLLQLIAITAHVPVGLVLPSGGSIGSGKERETDVDFLVKTVVDMEQNRIHVEILDRLVRDRTPFETAVIRFKDIDLSDPKIEAEIMEIIDRIRSLNLKEKRERMPGITADIDPDDPERSERLGKIMLFGASDTAMTPEALDESITAMIERFKYVEETEDEPNPDEPVLDEGQQRIADGVRNMLGGKATPEQMRQALTGIRDHVLPKAAEVLK